jgi:hypothetical protein
LEATETALFEFIKIRANTKPHLIDLTRDHTGRPRYSLSLTLPIKAVIGPN